jgi:hypothetical protein
LEDDSKSGSGELKCEKVESNPNSHRTMTIDQKRKYSIQMFNNDKLDTREVKLDPLNEKFFMYVFKALLMSQNIKILYLLLDVIHFYIAHETPCQKDVVNPATILWMLSIIDSFKSDLDLCNLAAKTVLRVVKNHEFEFEHQEMAIIRTYNQALQFVSDSQRDSLSSSITLPKNLKGDDQALEDSSVERAGQKMMI